MAAPAKRPADHKRKNPQRSEVDLRSVHTFTWDGEEWNIVPADATSLEFLEALEDERVIHSLRLLLGPAQAARLIKGRRVEDLEGFFNALGEVVGSGNP